MKRCRVISAYQSYNVGDIITPNGTWRDWLLASKYIVVLDDDEPTNGNTTIEAAVAPEPETAVLKVTKKRGRPRRAIKTQTNKGVTIE